MGCLEVTRFVQERERDICAREAAIEAREGSLTAREIQCVETQEDCRLRCSEAIAKVDAAKDEARRQVLLCPHLVSPDVLLEIINHTCACTAVPKGVAG